MLLSFCIEVRALEIAGRGLSNRAPASLETGREIGVSGEFSDSRGESASDSCTEDNVEHDSEGEQTEEEMTKWETSFP